MILKRQHGEKTVLSSEHIMEQLQTEWAGRNIIYKDVTGSTNDDAKKLGEEGAPHGTLVVADKQKTGRGTRGRSWENPEATNIAMSLLVRPTAPPDKIPMLTLVVGLSVAQGIEDALMMVEDGLLSKSTTSAYRGEILTAARTFPQIKWPNDVVISGKKICGILTELHMNPDNTIRDVVLGIGINVNNLDFPEELKDIAGSILGTTGHRLDRSTVVACCLKRFEENYDKYNQTLDLSLIKDEYELRLINNRKLVRVLDPKGEYEAIAQGITKYGALLVSDEEGMEHKINAGEVTVRGLYSYT